MKYQRRLILLVTLTIITIGIIALLQPISQDPAFHLFADQRMIAGIPNGWNVLSNIPFVVIGSYGAWLIARHPVRKSATLIYSVLFLAIVLKGVGSAYYHYHPDNNRLVYDRIPMTIVFMSFLSAAITRCINEKAAVRLLFPLVFTGVASVLWWHHTEDQGVGDLRFYALIQLYPVVFIPLIFWLFPTDDNKKIWPLFSRIIVWYIIAKVFEHFDHELLRITRFISGHSLKHMAAALSTWYIVRLFKYLQSPLVSQGVKT